MGAVLVYIWLRFEWQFAVGAVVALVHDVLITVGVFAMFQIRFDLTIIAALLTIVGYSLNDTVVVFDRVRENLRRFKKLDLKALLNLSINETMSRTVMTSGTTLLALIALLVLGGDVIRGFVFAMTFGIVIGTYSSIFVASAILSAARRQARLVEARRRGRHPVRQRRCLRSSGACSPRPGSSGSPSTFLPPGSCAASPVSGPR